MSTLGDRIKEARLSLGMSQAQLARKIGVSQGAIGHLERGRTQASSLLLRLASALGVSPVWLESGDVPFSTSDDEALASRLRHVSAQPFGSGTNVAPGPDLYTPIPLISWVQAGDWCTVVDNFAPGDAEEWLPCPRAHSPSAFALRVRGVSMEPKYQDGDIIFVDPEVQANHGRNVVVRLDNDEAATFKQLVEEGNKRYLRPLNPDWPGPKLIPINGNATICGVVIGKFVPE
ncbi:putative HTH-type transcriptional regulator [Achromobacter ruhlandii]|uniref:LexA family protein n=1 Tax=Achromobacter ruhlandii TaxID=72557 RepID=UPI001466C206|nr:XRE family transcriptional regulator [Achromobacter ruhlandii]CAB3705951.1 putative HTH-type transcriptional regulator [Achromobacter ruhlandii]